MTITEARVMAVVKLHGRSRLRKPQQTLGSAEGRPVPRLTSWLTGTCSSQSAIAGISPIGGAPTSTRLAAATRSMSRR